MYEIRRRLDDLRYRASLIPRRTMMLAAAALSGVLVLAVVLWWFTSEGSSSHPDEVAAFRERLKAATDSDTEKADLAALSAMPEKQLTAEVAARQQALNAIQQAGKLETPEGQAAWGALLRAVQVNTDRQRRAGKSEDR
ncbi:MAG: hypothetical protein AMXMBFR58_14570 [Phycisphaerae bacterium]